MQDLERLQVERECERLLADYCYFIDSGQASRVADLFTENAHLSLPIAKLEGNEQIRGAFTNREAMRERRSRHVYSNWRCDVLDESSAAATAYLTVYRNDGDPERTVSPLVGPLMVGEAALRFARTAEGWRVASYELALDFEGAES